MVDAVESWGAQICQQSVSSLESHIAREHHAVGLSQHPEVSEQARWQNRRRWGYMRRRVGGEASGTGTNGVEVDEWGDAVAKGTAPPKQGRGRGLYLVACSAFGGCAAGVARPVTLSPEAGAASTVRKQQKQEGKTRASAQPHARSGLLLRTLVSLSVAAPGRVEVLS